MDRRYWRLGPVLVLALGLGAGCGGSDEQAPSMVPHEQKQRADQAANNRAPTLQRVALLPKHPRPGESVRAVVEASDPDGDKVRFRYTWQVNRRPVAGGGARLDGSGLGKDDRVELVVVATDGRLESGPLRASARVANQAPKVLRVGFDPLEGVRPGDVVTALVEASDSDDDRLELEYRWRVNGEDTRERGRTFATDGLRRGDRIEVRVRARDGDDSSGEVTSPELLLANRPPRIAGIPSAEREGDAFRYRFEASDPDGDRTLRFSLAQAPAGMTIDPIYGIATWRPTESQIGSQVIEVQVADPDGDASSLRFEVSVTATETPAQAAPAKRAE
jgi:hypothetical protein